MAIPGGQVIPASPLAEAMASLTIIPRKHLASDGTEPGGSGGQKVNQAGRDDGSTAASEDQANGPPIGPTLEQADDSTAFRTLDALNRSQDRLGRNRWAIDLYHTWLDNNVPFGKLDKVPNQNAWIAKLAPGVTVERSAAVPGKAADLCNKVTDALLADPPKPNPNAKTDDEAVDAAAELCAEVLRTLAGEAGLNEIRHYRWALRNALTRSTSFLEYDIDPTGGGYQPMQVSADPQAEDVTNPLMGPDGVPTADPIMRYVGPPTEQAPSGVFVEQASQADRVWLPKVIIRDHRREKVKTFPPTKGVADCDLLLLSDWCVLSEGRKRWPDTVGQMQDEELQALASWRPSNAEMLVPFSFKTGLADGMAGPQLADVGGVSPLLQRRMYFYRCVIRPSPEYPGGLSLDMSGSKGGLRLGMKSLEYQVTLPTGGTDKRCREIPFVQITPNQDVEGQDPMGWPFEARFDGSAQADATLMAGYLDALDRMNHPHVFLRSTTAVDEDDWFDRSLPIILNPADQAPFYEQFPPLPPIVPVSEYLQTRQDTASGLTATAQGLDSQNSQSGIAKQLTVRQAQVSLAGMQQDLHGGFTRGWRITSQLVQAEYQTPQLMKMSGEDSSSQEQWWTGEDLAGIDDIGIEPGTGSLMTPEGKANLVAFAQGEGWLDPERAREIAMSGMSRDLGLPPDATKAAIERAVRLWLKGPPNEQWVPQYQQYEQQKAAWDQAQQAYQQAQTAFQQYQQNLAIVNAGPPQPLGPEQQNAQAGDQYAAAVLAINTAQQQAAVTGVDPSVMPQPPQGQAPVAPWSPFETRPNDTEPAIAHQWMVRLSHGQFHPRYTSFAREWRAVYDARYMQARQVMAQVSQASAPAAHQASQPKPAAKSPQQQLGAA